MRGLTNLAAWLERLAKAAHGGFSYLAGMLAIVVMGIVISDRSLQWIENQIPFEQIGPVGGFLGKAAVVLGLAAILYYIVRESFLQARKRMLPLPAWLEGSLKYWIPLLRLMHPLLGVVVFSQVVLHGYIMWQVWSSGNLNNAVYTGLVAAGAVLLSLMSGFSIRRNPKKMDTRVLHRIAGILFFLFVIVHRWMA